MRGQPRRHLLSIDDLGDEDLRHLVRRGAWFASIRDRGYQPLRGHVVGIYFRKSSTRTRTAFSAGALLLGASIIGYGPDDLQENTGESAADTGRVLSGMLDALVARTAGAAEELRTFAAQDRMAVVNAMSAAEHPTQALADLSTLLLRFGRIEGLRLLYVGEGNNTAAALALALGRFGRVELHLRTPPGYGLDPAVRAQAELRAKQSGAVVLERHDLTDLPRDPDVVYASRWQTTGTTKPDPAWRSVFAPFQVDEVVMTHAPDAVFMHDLPAHRGEEVTAGVLDGHASIAFDQAANKLPSAQAVLEWCLLGPVAAG